MEALVDEGLSRAIGLSDIDVEGTREIVDTARIKPAVVEVESHPYHPQWELHELCKTHGIILLAFASLGHALEPRLLDDPLIVSIAQRLERPQRKCFWPGVFSAAPPFSPDRSRRPASARTSTSPRFPRARSKRSASGSKLGSGSIPLSTAANRDSPRCLRTGDDMKAMAGVGVPPQAPTVVTAADGVTRCRWATETGRNLTAYHDDEWGRPTHDETALFEALALTYFENGLSWASVFDKRDNLRKAFHGFNPAAVAAMAADDVERLMTDARSSAIGGNRCHSA